MGLLTVFKAHKFDFFPQREKRTGSFFSPCLLQWPFTWLKPVAVAPHSLLQAGWKHIPCFLTSHHSQSGGGSWATLCAILSVSVMVVIQREWIKLGLVKCHPCSVLTELSWEQFTCISTEVPSSNHPKAWSCDSAKLPSSSWVTGQRSCWIWTLLPGLNPLLIRTLGSLLLWLLTSYTIELPGRLGLRPKHPFCVGKFRGRFLQAGLCFTHGQFLFGWFSSSPIYCCGLTDTVHGLFLPPTPWPAQVPSLLQTPQPWSSQVQYSPRGTGKSILFIHRELELHLTIFWFSTTLEVSEMSGFGPWFLPGCYMVNLGWSLLCRWGQTLFMILLHI